MTSPVGKQKWPFTHKYDIRLATDLSYLANRNISQATELMFWACYGTVLAHASLLASAVWFASDVYGTFPSFLSEQQNVVTLS